MTVDKQLEMKLRSADVESKSSRREAFSNYLYSTADRKLMGE